MELFKRANTTEEKNETAEMPAMTDDLEVVELGADDSAIQSARAAVEAMKNGSYFSQTSSEATSAGLPPTTPVFSAEQLADGKEEEVVAAETIEEVVAEEKEETVVEAVQEEATETASYEGPAQSAAEAVARLNTPVAAPVSETTTESPVATVEEVPEWKNKFDAVETSVTEKSYATIAALKAQVASAEESMSKQIQELLSAMRSQLKVAEDAVNVAVKDAGAGTDKVIEAEKVKLTSAFELEKQTMNANFEKRLAEMQEKHDAEIRDLKSAHTQEITQIKDDQINALDKMKNMYGDQMEEMQTAYREKNAALKREMDQYKEKLEILMLEHDADPFMVAETPAAPVTPVAPATPTEEPAGGLE